MQASDRRFNVRTKFHTNQVLLHHHTNNEAFTVFVPCYTKLKVKNISFLDLAELEMQIKCTLSITVYYGDLPHEIVRYLQRNIYLIFQQDQAIRLGAHQIDEDIMFRDNEEKREFNYVLRKNLPISSIHPYLFLTPYELIDCILTVNIRITPLYHNQPILYFKVNLMDDGRNYDNKFVYTKELNVQNYGFAEKRRHIQFSSSPEPKTLIHYGKSLYNFNFLINQDTDHDLSQLGDNNQNIEEFRFVHYHFPLYKFPTATIGTIFLPLLILTLINLSIFFQSNELSERIANIAMLMIAFLALIPVVHSQMPLQKLTLIQVFVYLEISTTILCLVESVIISQIPQNQYTFTPLQNGYFLSSLIISLFICVVLLTITFINIFHWTKQHRQSNKKFGKFIKIPVDRQKWNKNQESNQAFYYIWDQLISEEGNKDEYAECLQILKIRNHEKSYILHDGHKI